jgi:hypothetical protein
MDGYLFSLVFESVDVVFFGFYFCGEGLVLGLSEIGGVFFLEEVIVVLLIL